MLIFPVQSASGRGKPYLPEEVSLLIQLRSTINNWTHVTTIYNRNVTQDRQRTEVALRTKWRILESVSRAQAEEMNFAMQLPLIPPGANQFQPMPWPSELCMIGEQIGHTYNNDNIKLPTFEPPVSPAPKKQPRAILPKPTKD
jgi:hypothetical protein